MEMDTDNACSHEPSTAPDAAVDDLTALQALVALLKNDLVVNEANAEHQAHFYVSENRQQADQIASLKQELLDLQQSQLKKDAALQALEKESQARHRASETFNSGSQGNLETLESEKRDLTMIISKRQMEIDRLHEDEKGYQRQLEAGRAELRAANTRLTELETQSMRDKLMLDGKEQQLVQAQKQTQWLSEELKKKSEETFTYRIERSNDMTQLRTELDTTIQEKASLESRNLALQRRNDDLDATVHKQMTKLEECETRLLQKDGSFRTEMDAQKRLTHIYENNLKEAQAHLQELQKTFTEAQEDWEEERAELSANLEATSQQCEDWKRQLDDRCEEVDRLQYSLRQDPDNSTSNSPAALSQSQSSRTTVQGMTFTTLYTSYEDEKERRIQAERELDIMTDRFEDASSKLQEYSPYVQELESNARRFDERATELATRLSKARTETKAAADECTALRWEASRFADERRSFQQDIHDLCRQVHAFCLQLHLVQPGAQPDFEQFVSELLQRCPQVEDCEEMQADAMISSELVQVRTIEELVQQNVNLRRIARNLARQSEEAQQQLEARCTQATLDQVETLTSQLCEIKEANEKLSRQLRFVVKQRNDLRTVKGQNSGDLSQTIDRSGFESISSHAAPISEGQFKILYNKLREDFDNYTKETGISNKELSAQLNRKRDENTGLAIELSKIKHQLGFQQERYKLLASSSDMQAKENQQLRQQLGSLTNAASQEDSKKQEVASRLMDERLRAEALASQLQQSRIERDVWEASKNRALQECQDLLAERNMANERARSAQLQLEDREEAWRHERKRLEDKADSLDKEVALHRKQLHSAMEESRALMARKEAEAQTAAARVQRLLIETEKLKGQVDLIQNKETTLTLQHADLTARLTASEAKVASYESHGDGTATTAEERCRNLEKELAITTKTLRAAQADLTRAKEREINLKELAEGSDRELLEFNQTYDTYKAEKEVEIGCLSDSVGRLESLYSSTLEQMKSTDRELIEARELLETERHQTQQATRSLEAQIEAIKKSEALALEAQSSLQADVQRQANMARQANESYEKEVMAHAHALQSVQTLKQQLETLTETLANTKQQLELADMNLTLGRASWSESERLLNTQMDGAQGRIEDLQAQNQLLHSQFERMQESQKVTDRSLNESGSPGKGQSAGDDLDTIRELRELVRYARNERDILQTKLDIAASEGHRCRLELTHMQGTVDELRVRLDEERKKGQDSLQDSRRHQELMEKIEQANLLRESNVTLRDQVEHGTRKIKDLEEQLARATAELEPLRERTLNAQAEVEARKEENNALLEDNKRWKERVDQILKKYQRIDPVDYERLKQEVSKLESEKQELVGLVAQAKQAQEEARTKLLSAEEVGKKLRDVSQKQRVALEARSKQIQDIQGTLAETMKRSEDGAGKEREIERLRDLINNPEKHERFQAEVKRRQEIVQQANATLAKFKERNRSLSDDLKAAKQENLQLQAQLTAAQEDAARSLTGDAAAIASTDPASAEKLEQMVAEITTLRESVGQKVAHAVSEHRAQADGELNALKLRLKLLESQLASEKKRVSQLTEQLQARVAAAAVVAAPLIKAPAVAQDTASSAPTNGLSPTTSTASNKRTREDVEDLVVPAVPFDDKPATLANAPALSMEGAPDEPLPPFKKLKATPAPLMEEAGNQSPAPSSAVAVESSQAPVNTARALSHEARRPSLEEPAHNAKIAEVVTAAAAQTRELLPATSSPGPSQSQAKEPKEFSPAAIGEASRSSAKATNTSLQTNMDISPLLGSENEALDIAVDEEAVNALPTDVTESSIACVLQSSSLLGEPLPNAPFCICRSVTQAVAPPTPSVPPRGNDEDSVRPTSPMQLDAPAYQTTAPAPAASIAVPQTAAASGPPAVAFPVPRTPAPTPAIPAVRDEQAAARAQLLKRRLQEAQAAAAQASSSHANTKVASPGPTPTIVAKALGLPSSPASDVRKRQLGATDSLQVLGSPTVLATPVPTPAAITPPISDNAAPAPVTPVSQSPAPAAAGAPESTPDATATPTRGRGRGMRRVSRARGGGGLARGRGGSQPARSRGGGQTQGPAQ
ncbi:hypothetical protein HKX48_006451 [Thoreauomyces humboldtii]|nr:hypothetical protein HKX48_006451 [Thoreauomyces humboldtii]